MPSLESAIARLFASSAFVRSPYDLVSDLFWSVDQADDLVRRRFIENAEAWLNSESPRLRLAAGLGYLSGIVPGEPKREELLKVFDTILAESDDARTQEFAAYGIAWLYITADVNVRDHVPAELQGLLRYLAHPQKRHAALVGLTIVRGNVLGDICLLKAELLDPVTRFLTDESLPAVDRVLALKLASLRNTNARLCTRTAQAMIREANLSMGDLSDMVAILLANGASKTLPKLIGDSDIPLARRLSILDCLTTSFGQYLFWQDWKPLVNADAETEVGERILRLFGSRQPGVHWNDFLEMAQDPKLPLPWRMNLFVALWNGAEKLREDPEDCRMVTEVLLRMGSDPEVASRVFVQSERPSFARDAFPDGLLGTARTFEMNLRITGFKGALAEDLQSHILHTFRDPKTPTAVRYLLGRGFLAKTPLDAADTELLIQLWIQVGAQQAAVGGGSSANDTWSELNHYVRFHKGTARIVCEDERVPLDWRIKMLSQAPLPSILKLGRTPGLSEAERHQIAIALSPHIPPVMADWIRSSPGSESWQLRFLETTELFSGDPTAFMRVCTDATKPEFLFWLAAEWIDRSVLFASTRLPHDGPEAERLPIPALALSLALGSTEDPRSAPYHRLLAKRLAAGKLDTRGRLFLAFFLLRHAQSTLAELCADNTIPVEQRLQLVRCVRNMVTKSPLSEDPVQDLAWSSWQDAVLRSVRGPLGGPLLDLFAAQPCREYWLTLLQVAKEPNLPPATRSALFRELWTAAGDIERQLAVGSLASILLDLGSNPEVIPDAFCDVPIPPYSGRVDHDMIGQIIANVRDPTKPPGYRSLFAELVRAELPLTFEDRASLVEVLVSKVSGSGAVKGHSADRILQRIAAHARAEPLLARSVLFDKRLPDHFHGVLLRDCDHQTQLWYLQHVGSDDRNQVIAYRALESQLSWRNARALYAAMTENGEAWRQVVATPELINDDFPSIVALATHPQKSDLVRGIAQDWALVAARKEPGGTSLLLQRVFQRLADSELTPDVGQSLVTYANTVLADDNTNEAILDLSIGVCMNDAVPIEYRQKFLAHLSWSYLRRHGARLWEELSLSSDRQIRAEIFRRLVSENFFVSTTDATQALRLLLWARTPEEIAKAEKAWEPLARLTELTRADVPALIRMGRDAQLPGIVTVNAIHRIEARYVDNAEMRRLWMYLATPEGHSLWDETPVASRLRDAVLAKMRGWIDNADLENLLSDGPRASVAYWNALVQLALLPDQALAGEVFRKLAVPDRKLWDTWRAEVLPDVPETSQMMLGSLYKGSVGASNNAATPGVALFQQAFALARRTHSRSSELTQAIAHVVIAPPNIRQRILRVLDSCASDSPDDSGYGSELVTDLIHVLRYGYLEAQMIVQQSVEHHNDFNHDPDLDQSEHPAQIAVPSGSSLRDLASRLRGGVIERLQGSFPATTRESLENVLQLTDAPALLAVHYQRVHAPGLSLLAEAINAQNDSATTWSDWRYERPQAQAQLNHLTPSQRQQWRENLETPVAIENVSHEIAVAGRRIRERFQRALQEGEVPAEFAVLIRDVSDGSRTPSQQIQRFETLKRALGRRLGGEAESLRSEIGGVLPESATREIADLLGAPELTTDVRTGLLSWRHRLDRAIDLLRLLHCDDRALARNMILAAGDPASAESRTESAIAHVDQLVHAFSHPATRRQKTEDVSKPQLQEAFHELRSILGNIKTFATSRALVAVEHDDFKTLIEIGNQPYGQGSCQNYASRSAYNHALLAYAVDAMTKAIVIQTSATPEHPRGIYVARAIVRLGKAQDSGAPVLVLEKTYAAGGETAAYDSLIRKAARHFAAARGWKLVVPESRQKTKTGKPLLVEIPESQNGAQYEDGWESMTVAPRAVPNRGYVLRSVEL